MVCSRCKKDVVPQVQMNQGSKMVSRYCPECGQNMESLLSQDADQIRVKSKWGLLIIAVLAAAFYAAFLILDR